MLTNVPLKTLGRCTLLYACLMGRSAYAQDFALLSGPTAHIMPAYTSDQRQLQTLGQILQDIEKAHNVSFLCRSELLEMKINKGKENFREKAFARVLQSLIKPYGLEMKQITQRQFAISSDDASKNDKAPEVDAGSTSAMALRTVWGSGAGDNISWDRIQVMRVTGTVKGAAGVVLPGVTVTVKGKGNGTVTDANGRFEISVPGNDVVLVFSYVGYFQKEVPVSGQQSIDVVLNEDTRQLNQVVVVGFGTQKKVNLTGAVSMVGEKDLASRPLTSMSVALQGLMPGLTVVSNSGFPGDPKSTIRVRGVGTTNNANPFILIDGVPGDINFLNPADIESVSVLKDAASASIYGSRAANGVILVTTKKGKLNQTPTVSYNGYYGQQRPYALPKMLGAPEYMSMLNEAQRNVGLPETYTEADIQKAKDGTDPDFFANTNWPKALSKGHAPLQEHNLSLNGGAQHVSYYLSYGRLDQKGLIIGDQYKALRNNLRARINAFTLFDILDVDANIGYIDRSQNQPAGGTDYNSGPIYSALTMSPLTPVKFTNGGWGYGGGSSNPAAIATDGGYNNFKSQEVTGNITGKLHLLPHLDITGQYGTNIINQRRATFSRKLDYYYPDSGEFWYTNSTSNSLDMRDYTSRMNNLSLLINYDFQMRQHHVKLLGGYQQETYRYESWAASKQNFVSDDVPVFNLGSDNPNASGDAYQYALRSWFGRVNYDYKEKYLLELNLRYDGSSRYAPDERYGAFPSASAAWRFTQENFLKESSSMRWLNEGKLRVSYGNLGNQYGADGNAYSEWYPYQQVVTGVGTMPIGNILTRGLAQTNLANVLLRWEKVNMLNIGVDLAFLNNRLAVTADWFNKRTMDIQLRVPQPDVLGLQVPDQNAGNVSNKGWELSIGWNDHIQDFTYGLTAQLSDVRNKIESLGGAPAVLEDRIRQVGYPIDAFYGYRTDGLAQEADFTKDATTGKLIPKFAIFDADQGKVAPGDIKYRDLNGDNKITADKDREVIGNAFPRYTYSLRGNLGWKNIDFAFFLQGVGKGNGYVGGIGIHTFQAYGSYPQEVHRDHWTPEHTDAWYPRFTFLDTRNSGRQSDYWLQNAAYLRLKNIQIGYTLPSQWLSKARIQRIRAYVSADNLLTKTKFFYAYDPETVTTNGGEYPQIKTVVFGINVNFK
ncbi:TonB-dependent receptor [Chitinophaga sp. S165]|uniref:SusC/RagA family TonB-linked outer membrane protein n=1 Tax=Chitinophaga sp. S165 TaxID=2135462 RepID=UPI000D7149AC|nr:TonB-dependent receptor [Chitinophaga sp. S165]PWV53575.1 TonB-linked SusC/RagA family outer membrane protein [Chitinophaga sp. S165]